MTESRRVLFDAYEERENRKPASKLRHEARLSIAQAEAYGRLIKFTHDEVNAAQTTPDMFEDEDARQCYIGTLREERRRLMELENELYEDANERLNRIVAREK